MISIFGGAELDGVRMGDVDGGMWKVVAPKWWQLRRWSKLLFATKAKVEFTKMDERSSCCSEENKIYVWAVRDYETARSLGIPGPGAILLP